MILLSYGTKQKKKKTKIKGRTEKSTQHYKKYTSNPKLSCTVILKTHPETQRSDEQNHVYDVFVCVCVCVCT